MSFLIDEKYSNTFHYSELLLYIINSTEKPTLEDIASFLNKPAGRANDDIDRLYERIVGLFESYSNEKIGAKEVGASLLLKGVTYTNINQINEQIKGFVEQELIFLFDNKFHIGKSINLLLEFLLEKEKEDEKHYHIKFKTHFEPMCIEDLSFIEQLMYETQNDGCLRLEGVNIYHHKNVSVDKHNLWLNFCMPKNGVKIDIKKAEAISEAIETFLSEIIDYKVVLKAKKAHSDSIKFAYEKANLENIGRWLRARGKEFKNFEQYSKEKTAGKEARIKQAVNLLVANGYIVKKQS